MVLFLASQSQSRKNLLTQAQIPFKVVTQEAKEILSDKLNLEEQVKTLAQLKMSHVNLQEISDYFKNNSYELEKTFAYILTSDTLTASSSGKIMGKPKDREDAINMIRLLRGESLVATAYCLEKKEFSREVWKTVETKTDVVTSICRINIEEKWIENYLSNISSQNLAGALAIENYGMQFVQSINGSYSAILGLPLYELRQSLEAFGFFSSN